MSVGYYPDYRHTSDNGRMLRDNRDIQLFTRDGVIVKYRHFGHYDKQHCHGYFYVEHDNITPTSPLDIKDLLGLSDFEYNLMLSAYNNSFNLIKGMEA